MHQSPRRSGALLENLARRMRLHGESVLEPLGLRPRHLVALTVLRDRDGITQQALAATLMMDRATVVCLLNELESDALIERKRSPEDRRRHIVQLTDRGAERLAEAECALAAVEEEVLCALNPAQRATLYELLLLAASGPLPDSCDPAPVRTASRPISAWGGTAPWSPNPANWWGSTRCRIGCADS